MNDDSMNDDSIAESSNHRASPHRRCLVTGEVRPKAELLRFVVGPDGKVVPDLKGNLPGRGMWLLPFRGTLEEAIKKRAFARAAKAKVTAEADLAVRVEAMLRGQVLGALGLLRRQGRLVAGFEKTRALLASGNAAVWIEAADGAADGRAKLRPLATEVPCLDGFTRLELAQALGRDDVVHAAVERCPAAEGLRAQAQRLAGFLPGSAL